MTSQTTRQDSAPDNSLAGWPRWLPLVLIVGTAICLSAIRLTAPPNLLDQDQERPASYVLDVVKNGNWICQRDWTGDITSKPPMYTWLCALIATACGRINRFALYLPCGLAYFGMAWLIWRIGRQHFGERAALFGALAIMLTTAGAKGFGLARTDSVFAFMVTAAALLAWRAWNRGSGWTWFWLAAAGATLTKGPLGLVFASGGLLACVWERKSGERLPLKGSHLAGVVLFFTLTLGWFLLSYWQLGEPVVAKLIGKELVGNAVKNRKGDLPGTLIWKQPLYYLSRGLPWSLLAYYGLWRIWRRPASRTDERRFERFLFCWFLLGLLILALSPHQRADLLWPIMPAGALIAGREVARLTQRLTSARVQMLAVAVAGVGIIGFAIYYFAVAPRQPIIRQTIALKNLAAELERTAGPEFPITHLNAPTTLQFYLNTLRPLVTAERAAELLRGPDAAFVAVKQTAVLDPARRAEDPPLFVLWPPPRTQDCPVQIVGNRATFDTGESFAFCFGPIFVRAKGAQLLSATEKGFCFRSNTPSAEVLVTNESEATREIRVGAEVAGKRLFQTRTLAAGETWHTTLSTVTTAN